MVYKIYNTSSPLQNLQFRIADRLVTLPASINSEEGALDLESPLIDLNIDYITNFSRSDVLSSASLQSLITSGNITVTNVRVLNDVPGVLRVEKGGLGLTSCATGDLFFGSGTNTIGILPRDRTGIKFLSNSGPGGTPAWTNVDTSISSLSIEDFAGGVGASNLTFWRGDGVWAPPINDAGDIVLSNGSAYIASGVIVDSDINANAAITLSKLAALTIDRALVSNGSGVISVSAVTSTELGYLSGVTGSIQTQLNGKANVTLNNLSGVAINTSLLPVDDTKDLGSNTKRWNNVHSFNNILYGATSGTLTLSIPATTTSYGLIFPNAQGGVNTVLTNDGAGNLSWGVGGSGFATVALDNLSGVAINTSLVSDTNNTDSLGSPSIRWLELHVRDSLLYGNTSGAITLKAADVTTSHTIKMPAAQGGTNTILYNDGAGNLSWVNRTLTAGAGLTGGGDLTADRTFDVVANADGSIVVNANDIQVGILATDVQHGNRGNGSLHTVATTLVAGFMSATDKTKLDGISSGAAALTSSAPVDVTKAAAAVGVATTAARADHKHDISTAVVVAITDSTNAEGSATSLARSDHTHSHGTRGGGTLHSDVTTSTAGFMSAADKVKLNRVHAGTILNAAFAGNPKVATVTFGTAMPDTNYRIGLGPLVTSSGSAYTPVITAKTVNNFTVSMTVNNITNLTALEWQVLYDYNT